MDTTDSRYMDLLDALTRTGRYDRAGAGREPNRRQLITLARRLAEQMRSADLLVGYIDSMTLADLRDAYNDGRAPNLIDFDQVRDELKKLRVPAELQWVGGEVTLLAGPVVVLPYDLVPDQENRVPRRAVSLGPGNFFGDGNTQPAGYVDQISYGSAVGYGESRTIEPYTSPADIAADIDDLIGTLVALIMAA